MLRLFSCCFIASYFIYTAAVKGVTLTVLNDTSINITWNPLIIPDFPVDFYTVIYIQLQWTQDEGEKSAVFTPPATHGVIAGLDPYANYQFGVFATVTVDGEPVEGERSTPVYYSDHSEWLLGKVVKSL